MREGDTDKSLFLYNTFTGNQRIMPQGGDGGYNSVVSMNSSKKQEHYDLRSDVTVINCRFNGSLHFIGRVCAFYRKVDVWTEA